MGIFDWFTSGRLTCDWNCHRARGSRGGEDRYHRPGSPILAPYDAVVTYGMYSDGASYVQFKYSNGYAHRAIHNQQEGRVPNGSHVSAGTLCALSDGRIGTFGAGTSSGSHIHFQGHAPDGTRIPWQDVPPPVSLSGGSSRPITQPETKTEEETFMRLVNITGNEGVWFLAPGIAPVKVQDTYHLTLLIRLIENTKTGDDRETFNARERDIIGVYLRGIAP